MVGGLDPFANWTAQCKGSYSGSFSVIYIRKLKGLEDTFEFRSHSRGAIVFESQPRLSLDTLAGAAVGA